MGGAIGLGNLLRFPSIVFNNHALQFFHSLRYLISLRYLAIPSCLPKLASGERTEEAAPLHGIMSTSVLRVSDSASSISATRLLSSMFQ
ncbi:Sodium:neurotransmitter symporter family protein [Colletotrichum melonis]|uniref:Sodium:neurotransmitter symporter family protein n=1 Tax=Colletotrichum melonis TaxID=1209925 RepID=A0AAI9URI0_9PEZI|nr:Sodium:neurotransmitter symporter family protein [Colletotrichum melonis]